MDLASIARYLPHPLKQPLRYIYGALPPRIRYSKVFWETYNFLQESQWWSREKLEEYQMQQLSQLLKHAYENVPYYRRVFDERGLKPKDIQCLGDLKKLPYLTKEIIRENLPELVARNYPKSKLQYVTTSGSTGRPLGFYRERGVTTDKELAFITTMWSRVGFKIGDRYAILRGSLFHSAGKGKFWEYNPVSKNLILASYHMTDETLPNYIEKIREFRPDFIWAYPSAIAILARFMRENSVAPFATIKAILCGSENLYQWQRGLLEDVFHCRAYSWYGHSERAALAGQCEKSNNYHVQSEYGILELVNEKGKLASGGNEMGEIVATGFNNLACPLIRYRTMDLAIHTNGECECGRSYSLLKRIEGRLQELIVASDGSLVALGPAIFGIHDAEWTKVKQIQFLQETQGELIIQVVKDTSFSDSEIASYVLRLFKARLEGRCKLIIRFVDRIPRTRSGKYRFLIQQLPIKFGD